MSPLPVALCGKNPNLAGHFVELMNDRGEYQVVTVFHDPSAATSELRNLLTGSKSTKPASNLGSNASSLSSIAPRAIIVGAGFSGDEVETMRQSLSDVEGAAKLAWFTPSRSQPQRPGQSGFMESVVGRAREALEAHSTGEGDVEGGVFGF